MDNYPRPGRRGFGAREVVGGGGGGGDAMNADTAGYVGPRTRAEAGL